MPVPVPLTSKPVAHLAIKQNQPSIFHNLTRTLPVSPTGPPPSFGTREEWINSLPSWRRAKPRQTWDDDSRATGQGHPHHFQQGLTVAANASVIKGSRAQACIPPPYTMHGDAKLDSDTAMHALFDSHHGFDGDADDEMSSDSSNAGHMPFDTASQWTASSPVDDLDMESFSERYATEAPPAYGRDQSMYERGAFTPVFEEESPDSSGEPNSSPVGPVTPFADFVDRAVAAASQAYMALEQFSDGKDAQSHFVRIQSPQPQSPEIPKEPAPPEPVVTPSATATYKKLAEPLSEWVANYVWKVCTTGMSLPPAFTYSRSPQVVRYSSSPPSYLAGSVHCLLLSTLLQPSAILLAVWYIVRLPVYFGSIDLEVSQLKEIEFRTELLGDARTGVDIDMAEVNAPFRLILLGCMLANKWLDDHTFSNKTWHTISNVPVQSLNRLESLALGLFNHNLSVPTRAWSQWLAHIQSYHISLSSPRPQPISRPSSNPHLIIRKTIEELVESALGCDSCGGEVCTAARTEPIFLGLEKRRVEKLEKEQATHIDISEIDLDEDGPLREEYLPRRRASGAGSIRSAHSRDTSGHSSCPDNHLDADARPVKLLFSARTLPPPAKWSPAGDEPILRERNRDSGRYVAVQPPADLVIPPTQYASAVDARYQGWTWFPAGPLQTAKPLETSNVYEAVSRHALHPSYCYTAGAPVPLARQHLRPFSCDQENLHPVEQLRPGAQPCFDYQCGYTCAVGHDLRADPYPEMQWSGYDGYSLPSINYQLPWLRA